MPTIYYIYIYTYIHVQTYLYIAASLKHRAKAQSLPPGNQAWRPHHDVDAGSDHCNFPKPRQKTNTLNKLVLLEAVPFICKLFFGESRIPQIPKKTIIHWVVSGCLLTMGKTWDLWPSLGRYFVTFSHLHWNNFGEILRNGFTASNKKVSKIDVGKFYKKVLHVSFIIRLANKEQQTKILEASNAKSGLTMKGAWHPTTSLTCCCWCHALTTRH